MSGGKGAYSTGRCNNPEVGGKARGSLAWQDEPRFPAWTPSSWKVGLGSSQGPTLSPGTECGTWQARDMHLPMEGPPGSSPDLHTLPVALEKAGEARVWESHLPA